MSHKITRKHSLRRFQGQFCVFQPACLQIKSFNAIAEEIELFFAKAPRHFNESVSKEKKQNLFENTEEKHGGGAASGHWAQNGAQDVASASSVRAGHGKRFLDSLPFSLKNDYFYFTRKRV